MNLINLTIFDSEKILIVKPLYNSVSLALSSFRKNRNTNFCRIDGSNVRIWILVSIFLDGRYFRASMELLARLYTDCPYWSSIGFYLCNDGYTDDIGFWFETFGDRIMICYILVREYPVKPKKLVLYISYVLSSWQWGLVSLYQRSLYYQFFVVE